MSVTPAPAGGEAHATRMAAEQAFQRGMALLRDAKTASAAIELRRASELQPESLEYLLYATWARARSYREVPIEADQQALLEIAQRAKRRDPTFAFGSYVIGQVSMWTGDEATAKKFFYEALRLDPDVRGRPAGAHPRATWNGGAGAAWRGRAAAPRAACGTRACRGTGSCRGERAARASRPGQPAFEGAFERREPVARAWPGASRDSGDRDLRRGETIAARGGARTERVPAARALRRRVSGR